MSSVREGACKFCDQIIYLTPSSPDWVTNPQAIDTWQCDSGPAHQPRPQDVSS